MKTKYLLTTSLMVLMALSASAQCRQFVKNHCRSHLEGYVPGETFNAAKLMPGDQAEMTMTMYSGQDYRLLVCGQQNLPAVEFEVFDMEQNLLFSNKENNIVPHFDFRVAGTQNLTVKLNVPGKSSASGISPQGCVAIMLATKLP